MRATSSSLATNMRWLRRGAGAIVILLGCGAEPQIPGPVPLGGTMNAATGGDAAPLATGGRQGPPITKTCERQPGPARVIPLSRSQYVAALRDLLTPTPNTGEPAGSRAGSIEFELVDRPWVTTATLNTTLRTAEDAVGALGAEQLQALLDCSALTDGACVESGLGKLATRAFSRPPSSGELAALMRAYTAGANAISDDGMTATRTALTALLLAPSTMYRTEFERSGQLTAHETAAALAALLLDSVPDADLLQAAQDGSLLQAAGVRAQVERLLNLPRVRNHLVDLVLAAFRIPRVFETPKDPALFPTYTPSLQQSMFEESRRFIEHVLWTRQAPIATLLTSNSTFVDGDLADLYSVAHPAADAQEFSPVELPANRSGLLTQASVLSVTSRTNKTSVVARGLFTRGAVMCLPKVPGPPSNLQAQIEEQLTADATEKELAAYRAATSPCLSCHSQFDRFGLVLEDFDAIGRHLGDLGQATGERIDLAGLGPLTGSVSSASELAELATADGSFTRCFAERMLDYALAETQAGDASCQSDPLHAMLDPRTATITDIVVAVATHPAFQIRREEP